MTIALAIIGSQIAILAIAFLVEELQDRAIRRRLRPADPVQVTRFLQTRRAGA